MKKNLICVRQLDDCGHSIHFGSEEWKVTKGAMVIALGNKRNTLYMTTNPNNVVVVVEANNVVLTCVRVVLWGSKRSLVFLQVVEN